MPADQRRGQAFCALLEAVDPDRLPLHGGTATTVVVTIPYDGTATGAGVGTLGDGTRITAGEARRTACSAPGSCPPSSTPTPKCSTSAGQGGCSPPRSARPSR